MIIEIEGAIVIALLAFPLLRGKQSKSVGAGPVLVSHPAMVNSGEVQIYKGSSWYCQRPIGHHDIREFLEAPGFSVIFPGDENLFTPKNVS